MAKRFETWRIRAGAFRLRETKASNLKNEGSRGFNEKEFLRELKSDHRNFAKRDAADLFTAIALANDTDGKLTEREMSLPSAFYSRGGMEDFAHSAGVLSDSEDANVSHRTNRSVTVSGPLGSDRSVGSESEIDRDSTIVSGNCAIEDLDLVESAILRILREDAHISSKQHDEDAAKPKDTLGLVEQLEGSEVLQSSAGSVDAELLSRLLEQIQTLRDHRHVGRAARSSPRSARSAWDISKGGKLKRLKNDDIKKAVEAATRAAKSAAEAANIAAALVTKNSDAVNKLLHSFNPSYSKIISKQKANDEQMLSEAEDCADSSDSDETKEIAKKIVSQNRFTHVVLGIMLVSSFVWRYIVVKVAKRVRSKVSDPWGYVGGILSDGFKGPEKETEKPQESSGGSSISQRAMQILHGERQEETEASTADGTEERRLSFGNLLQIKPNGGQ